jgi:gliding motility-associated-like protein
LYKPFLYIILLHLYCGGVIAQNFILSSNADGNIVVLYLDGCSVDTLYNCQPFTDIAITQNNKVYAINESLFEIDLLNKSCNHIDLIMSNAQIVRGTGLVALDSAYLISNHHDSLILVSTMNAEVINLGNIGHVCNGDFAFFNGRLYMINVENHLIDIEIDILNFSISSVVDLGFLNTENQSIYSVFSGYETCGATEKSLFAIDGGYLYKVNPDEVTVQMICILGDDINSFGAASIYDFEVIRNTDFENFPNVITPNGDGINDVFYYENNGFLDVDFSVYNRWGVNIYSSNIIYWDGTINNRFVSEGIYYYILSYANDCKKGMNYKKGYIQVLR